MLHFDGDLIGALVLAVTHSVGIAGTAWLILFPSPGLRQSEDGHTSAPAGVIVQNDTAAARINWGQNA